MFLITLNQKNNNHNKNKLQKAKSKWVAQFAMAA